MKLRIAIADDDLRTRQFLEESLSKLRCTVVSTVNGAQLLEACRKDRPDLVITDIKMPDMDGLAVAKAIWNEFSIPVIIISGCSCLPSTEFTSPEFFRQIPACLSLASENASFESFSHA